MFKKSRFELSSRLGLALVIALMLALPFASPAMAGEIIPGNPNAIVGPDEIIEDDIFISGETVRIDGTILGNVFAAGGEIIVNGRIEGSLFAAGQLLIVNGEVSGNVFAAGYSVEYAENAVVGGSAFFGGFSVKTAEGSQLARSLYMGGYQAELAGEIGRDVIASLSALQLEGKVDGDVLLELNESQDGVNTNPEDFTFYIPGNVEVLPEGIVQVAGSEIGGELDYRINRINIRQPEFNRSPDIADEIASAFVTNWVRTRIGDFFALLIVGGLFFYLLPRQSKDAAQELNEQPLRNMAWGLMLTLLFPLLFLVAIMLVIFIAVMGGLISLGTLAGTILSVGGLGVGAFWVSFGIIFWMLSKTVFAYLIGHKLLERVSAESLDGRWAFLIALAIGLVIYEILRAVPIFGAMLALLVILAGVGALFQVGRTMWNERKAV